MAKLLRIDCAAGADEQITYFRLKGNETEKELASIAADEFQNYANYGFSVIDESECDDLDDITDL